MKKTILLLIVVAATVGLFAQNSGLGVGIILGEPTGLSAKMWTGEITAFDAAAAWSFGDEGALHLNADMLFHNYGLINQAFPVYYGLGARVKLAEDLRIGLRVPVGIAYQIPNTPLDAFLEIVPVLDLIPDVDFGRAHDHQK